MSSNKYWSLCRTLESPRIKCRSPGPSYGATLSTPPPRTLPPLRVPYPLCCISTLETYCSSRTSNTQYAFSSHPDKTSRAHLCTQRIYNTGHTLTTLFKPTTLLHRFHAASTGRPFHTLTELLVLCKRTRESSMAVPNSFLGPRPQGPPAFSDPARPGLDLLAEYEALAAMFRVQWGRPGDGQWSGTTTSVPADPKAVPTTSSFPATSPDHPLIQSRVIARLREIAADGYLSHLTWCVRVLSVSQRMLSLSQPPVP